MTNALYNSLGVATPIRPMLRNDAVKKKAIKSAIEAMYNETSSPFALDERDELVEALEKHYVENGCSYELAKDFEDEGWDVDRSFIDNIERVVSKIEDAHRKAEKDWFNECMPVQPFEVGARLKVCGVNGDSEGVIDGIYKYSPAAYTVKMDGTDEGDSSRRIIKFESAELAQ